VLVMVAVVQGLLAIWVGRTETRDLGVVHEADGHREADYRVAHCEPFSSGRSLDPHFLVGRKGGEQRVRSVRKVVGDHAF
jgi:hypothetical protein